MRNWNPNLLASLTKDVSNCQPTYEELKLETVDTKDFTQEDCQPTYEELKQEKVR